MKPLTRIRRAVLVLSAATVALLLLFPPWQTRDADARFIGHRSLLVPGTYMPIPAIGEDVTHLMVDGVTKKAKTPEGKFDLTGIPDAVPSPPKGFESRPLTIMPGPDEPATNPLQPLVPILAWRVLVTELLTVIIIGSTLLLL